MHGLHAQKSIWTHRIELLDDVCHLESHFVYLEIVLVWVAIDAWFAPNAPCSKKTFWTHSMVLLGEEAQVEAWFGQFGDSANFMQDSCTVCMERTICLEINLDTPNGTPTPR